jgi:hypothetical protein
MPTPATRTPIKIARGSYSNLNSSIDDLQEGEIVYATDQNSLYVKEGSSLVSVSSTSVDDDSLAEVKLDISNTPSDGYFLQYKDSSDQLTWAVPTDTNTQLTTEQVQDIVGAMFTGNTETNIAATYEDSDGTIDLVADNDNTQLTTEQVQDIVGGMFTGNTETNISATYEDGDGTIDLVSTNTTYSAPTTSAAGLVPQLPDPHGGKFLKADGSWEVPPDTNTQVAIDDTPADGVTDEAISSNWAYDHNAATGNSAHVPAAGSSGQFLKHDGTWGTPPDTNTQRGIDDTPVDGETSESITSNWAYDHNAATGNSAHVPAAGSSGQFLKHDGTWGTPPDTNTQVAIDDTPVDGVTNEAISSNWAYDHNAATGNSAHVPAAGSSGEFLAHNGAWATPADATKMPLAGGTFTGSVTFEDAINENVYAITDATSPVLEPDNGMIQTWTLNTGSVSGTRTPSDSIAAGQSMLLMVDDGDGSDAITWPSTTWVGGSAPTLATSGYTVIELWKVASTLYAAHVGNVA